MSSTGVYTVFSPSSGTEYIAPASYWVIPNNATNVTVTVNTYKADGSTQTVSSLKAIIRNISAGSDASSQTGSGVFSVTRSSAAASNGTNIVAPAAVVTGSCDHVTMQITSYTGTPYSQGGVKVWSGAAWLKHPTKVWSGSAWVWRPLKTWTGSAWARRA